MSSACWWLASVSLRGRGHVAANKPCQDAHFVWADGNMVVLVVCDGAGGAELEGQFSHVGSSTAARVIGRLLACHVEEFLAGALRPEAILDAARFSLGEVAEEKGIPLKALATTLVALVADEGRVGTLHIGDGAAYMLDREIGICLSPPDREPTGTTIFVTSDAPRVRCYSREVPPHVTGFAVTSDGAEGLYHAESTEVHPLVAELIQQPDFGPGTDRLEGLMRECLVPASGDDITVVVARKPFISGVYGCPACGGHNVGAVITRCRGEFLVRCRSRSCKESALRVRMDEYPDAPALFRRNLLRAGMTATMVAQRIRSRVKSKVQRRQPHIAPAAPSSSCGWGFRRRLAGPSRRC